ELITQELLLVLILKGIVNLAADHCLAEPSKCALMNGTLKQMIVACIIQQSKTFKAQIIVLGLKPTFSTDIVTEPSEPANNMGSNTDLRTREYTICLKS
ncbi:MAG: hypothetical protein WAM42_22935, partial [Candidatus Nitrosopolaris sp.]